MNSDNKTNVLINNLVFDVEKIKELLDKKKYKEIEKILELLEDDLNDLIKHIQ